MMKHGDGVVVAAIAVLTVYGVECTDNITMGCSSRCTVDFDKDLVCWNETLMYFTDTFVGLMKQYISIQANIIWWYRYHELEPPPEETIIKESVDRMKKFKPPYIEDEDGIIDRNLTATIVEALVDAAQELASDNRSLVVGSCPYGCEKNWNMWMWLTIASFCCSGIFASIILFLSFLMDRADSSGEEKEPTENANDRKCCSFLEIFGIAI